MLSQRHRINQRVLSKGFSLVELMVAITISLVLLSGLIQIFISSKLSYNVQNSIARMQENGRYAVELLSKDLRLAGYMGGNADATTIAGTQPVSNNCIGSANTAWGAMIEQSVFGLNDALADPTANYTGCITAAGTNPQSNDYLSGDVLIIRYARPTQPATTGKVSSSGYYLNSSPTRGEIAPLIKGNDIDFDSLDGIDAIPKTYNKLESYAYYIGHQQADCNGNETAVPTLSRLSISASDSGTTPERQEIIRGIENLQIQYGEDSDNDGSPDQYRNANGVTNWSSVKAVRLWFLVRDECPSGSYNNNNTYVMGDFGEDNTPKGFTPNDNFRRHLYTTTVMLRNNETI